MKPIKTNPCEGKENVNSFFKVRPGDRGFPAPPQWCELVPCDTFNDISVLFEVPDGNPHSTYEWKIGSEIEPRTARKFEIDFSDYLNGGRWETSIPVSLTIRTPLNSCLHNPGDTLISVSRRLFFTEFTNRIVKLNEETGYLRGHLTTEPDKVVDIKFTSVRVNSFRGHFTGGLARFIIGLPFIDSLLLPSSSHLAWCYNFKHYRVKVTDTTHPTYSRVSNHLDQYDIFFHSKDSVGLSFFFRRKTGLEQFRFNGVKL